MKITKRQLRRIIREQMSYGMGPIDRGRNPAEEFEYDVEPEDSEDYKSGYQDALEGYPAADDAKGNYDLGYEDGTNDAGLEVDFGYPDTGPRLKKHR